MFDEIKWRFRLSIIFSLLILFMFIFEPKDNPNLADSVVFGLLYILIIILYLSTLIASLTCLLKFKIIKWKSFIPLSINIAVILFIIYVPINKYKQDFKFSKNKEIYNKIVTEVLNGKKFPIDGRCFDKEDISLCLVNISKEYPNISTDNNIDIVKIKAITYILFYDFRGFKDNYSGFLYVEDGGSPEKYDDEKLKIRFIEKNWYHVFY
ncbi:hypothetical protein ACNSOO_10885 [Aliarcobacter lanthieri]|uniref:hypothetical protein n=1 Tax=Aliarcobacter lanthieri TaxID=1355374 RepID=UPI003AAF2CF9